MNRILETLGDIAARCDGEIRTGPFGTQLHRSDYVDDPLDGVAVVMPKDMVNGRIDYSSIKFVRQAKALELSQHISHTGDVLLARRGDIGRFALVRDSDDGALCGTGAIKISLSESDLSPEYLSLYLETSQGRSQLERRAVGSTMPNINDSIVRSLEVEYPPLEAQQRIVETLFAYDELIENNTRRIKILEEMAQSIYKEWFVNFRYPGHENVTLIDSPLGLIPEGWSVLRIDQLADIHRGRSYRGADLVEAGGLPFLNLKCVNRDGGFRRDGIKRYVGPYKESHVADAHDVVIAVTDMTQERRIVARAARVPASVGAPAIVSMDLARLRARGGYGSALLYSVLRYSTFADSVKNFANGANVLHLNPDRIGEFEVAVGDEKVRAEYEGIVAPILDLAESLELSSETLCATRDLLLPRLVSGKVTV